MKKIHPLIVILAFLIAAGVYLIQVSDYINTNSENKQKQETINTLES